MNYNQKLKEIKRVKDLILNSYSQGCIKITKGESELHARVKCQVALYLLNQGYKVYTEVNLKGYNRRLDILSIHSSGSIIVEILASESEKQALQKENPEGLIVLNIDANKFDYKNFKL